LLHGLVIPNPTFNLMEYPARLLVTTAFHQRQSGFLQHRIWTLYFASYN
jgi:hypothetical protein